MKDDGDRYRELRDKIFILEAEEQKAYYLLLLPADEGYSDVEDWLGRFRERRRAKER